ncbi:MAG TPA: hypothetical protein VHE30_10665 [Polyangiaceae bacterium]|nr:hypothetical protein [Polyangiaceae bacterium]
MNFEPAPADPPPPPGPSLPQRIFGPRFKLDPTLGGGLRGWIPAQYPTVDVRTTTQFTWSIEMSATIASLIKIHRGYYESNGLAGPRHQGASVVADVGDKYGKAAWLLGMVGIPITKAWEPVIRYETRAFQTRATPNRPVRIVPYDTSPDTDLATIPETTNRLSMISGFETLVLAVRYDQSSDTSATIDSNRGEVPFPPFYVGVGAIQYSKPYQVTVGDSVLDSVLFDSTFRGAGLALGAELPGRPNWFIFNAAAQVGLGEVRLLKDLTLNELLPSDGKQSGLRPPQWLIGYVQGDVSFGYLWAVLPTKPTVLLSAVANGGGATFFYFKTRSEQGEKASTPPLNWDFLWGIRGYVTIPL